MLDRLPAPLRARFDAYAEGVNLWLGKLKADPSLRPHEFVAAQPRRPRRGARSTRPRSASSSRARSRATTAASWRTGRRCASSAPSASTACCRCAGRTRSRRSRPPTGASRRPPAARARTSARASSARSASCAACAPRRRRPRSAALIRGGSNAWAVRGSGNRAWLFHGPQLGFQIPEQLAELEVHRPGPRRPRRHAARPAAGRHRAQRPHRVGPHQRPDRRRRPVRRAPRGQASATASRARSGKMKCRTETFRVAGEQPVKRRLCRTVHGPVQARSARHRVGAPLRDLAARDGHARRARRAQRGRHRRSDAGRALNKVSWNENTMVADDQGNIGWWHPGRLPIRPKRWDERLPLPGTGSAEWRGFLRPSQRPHVINPDQGWLANWNNMPSVGWTVGDAPATERTSGRAAPRRVPEPPRRARRRRRRATTRSRPSTASAGTTAQQRALLDAQLRAAAAGATGGGQDACSTRSWPGTATTTAPTRPAPSIPAWRRGRRSRTRPWRRCRRAARDWLGGPGGSHAFDFGGADAAAFRELDAGRPAAGAPRRRRDAARSATRLPGASRAGCTT